MNVTKPAFIAVAIAGAALLAACDKSAQSGDGAVSQGSVGMAANTPTGQVVPTGADASKLEAPPVDPTKAAADQGTKDANAAAPAPQTTSAATTPAPAPEKK